ncbi:MAG: peptidyl-tRNA hydrolase Pth2 [Candidatus Bathyarchaeia archaeon]
MQASQEGFEFSQSIIVRADLPLSKGKLCVQVGHAVLLGAEEARNKEWKWWKSWLDEGQRKVVLKVNSLPELFALKNDAERLGLPTGLVEDRGLTEVPPGTITCLAVGPAPIRLIDKVTGRLPLL